jgi:hypothetical protein
MTCTLSIPGTRRDSYGFDYVEVPSSSPAINRRLTYLAYLAEDFADIAMAHGATPEELNSAHLRARDEADGRGWMR